MTLDKNGNLGVGTTSPSSWVTSGVAISGAWGSGSTGLSLVSSSAASATNIARIDFVLGNTFGGQERSAAIWGLNPNAGTNNGGALVFGTSANGTATTPTERARITSGGLLLVNTTSGASHVIKRDTSDTILTVTGNTAVDSIYINTVGSSGANLGSGAALFVQQATSTSRSINAAGTINASGGDYAEYMQKVGEFIIAKGDVCGINAEGKLTNLFSDAVSFVVKSTNPSYVGGDTWASEDIVGKKPTNENELAKWYEKVEENRQKVDRIAFSGQVPVNVLGATPGQYIVPVNDNGAIKGVAVSNPSFEQYQAAVGKVIAIEDDGRARIIVKVA
jgi:hypothetical protein